LTKANTKADSLLPVELVFAPQWWNKNAGISFDRDFFFHPARRVEDEQKMEQLLYDKWGRWGLGADHDKARPEQGAVHLASGFLLSEMLGCKVNYTETKPPEVVPKYIDELSAKPAEEAFKSSAFKTFLNTREALETKYGSVTGDVNWGGVLNLAIDLRGPDLLADLIEEPDDCRTFFSSIGGVIEKFTGGMQNSSHTTSISVNRNVRHLDKPVMLHSECTHTMISEDMYREFLMPFDLKWANECAAKDIPYGIHYCGKDPHRFAKSYGEIPNLAFFDLGWGGDVPVLRKALPNTFLNLRLPPQEISRWTAEQVKSTVKRLVTEASPGGAKDYGLVGICCINMDDTVPDANIDAIFEARQELLDVALGAAS
jgi:hypothetical protein